MTEALVLAIGPAKSNGFEPTKQRQAMKQGLSNHPVTSISRAYLREIEPPRMK